MTVLRGAAVVTPSGVLDGGWVTIQQHLITGVGRGSPPPGAARGGPAEEPRIDLDGGWLLPGYIDLHVHGGGGHDFGASPEDLAAGVAFHRANGTTRTLVSLVTAPVELLCEQLAWVSDLVERGPTRGGHVVGAHLEGPFLALARCGAQHPGHLRLPDPEVLDQLLRAGRGHVRTLTIAPELPGATEMIARLVAAGVAVAVGHTEADYPQARAAFAAGASLLTHTFNAMASPHHRRPGPVPAALDTRAVCEVVNDGVHVHPAMVRWLASGTGPDRLVLVTDAIDATGHGDGRYQLGGRDVVVSEGQARLVEDGALAGSTLTMGEALRRAVTEVGLDLVAASAAASGNPARILGLEDRCGAITPGLEADLVHLGADLRVRRVMAQGEWLTAPALSVRPPD